MPRGNYTIQRSCEECGKIFTPPTLVSKYCCPACSKRAYKKRQVAKEKEAIRQALIRRIPSNKGYLTVKEAMLIYGISKDVLYRMIRQGLIPSYNFGQRLIRLSRQYMDEHSPPILFHFGFLPDDYSRKGRFCQPFRRKNLPGRGLCRGDAVRKQHDAVTDCRYKSCLF